MSSAFCRVMTTLVSTTVVGSWADKWMCLSPYRGQAPHEAVVALGAAQQRALEPGPHAHQFPRQCFTWDGASSRQGIWLPLATRDDTVSARIDGNPWL
jgi:hypothetical protein